MTIMKPGAFIFAMVAGIVVIAPGALAQTCPRQSATGHVEFIGSVPNVNLGNHIVYSFSAIQTGKVDEEGNCVVEGEVQEFLYNPDGELLRTSHGTTVCIGVEPAGDGWTARIAARIDRTTAQLMPGIEYGIFKVVDNGEGENDPPDQGSPLRGATRADAYLHCAAGLPRPTAALIRGNVQVRP